MLAALQSMFTGKDNESHDIGRYLWALVTVGYIGLTGYHLWHGGAFDFSSWGTGAGAVLASGGAALGMKAHSEPGA